MGWAERFFQFDSELEQAMSAIGGLVDSQAKIETHLTELVRIDAAIVASEARFKADKVGSIELTKGGELRLLRSRGRQEVGRMSSLLGVEPKHDVFSGSAPSHRATRWGARGARGFLPQG